MGKSGNSHEGDVAGVWETIMTMMQPERSRLNFVGVHPDLCGVIDEVAQRFNLVVIDGLRTAKQQAALFAQGRTTPGLIVTDTLHSKHMRQLDGYGHALDVIPHPVDWENLARFDALALSIFSVASRRRVFLRWGADWDGDGQFREKREHDSPHWEI